MNEDDADNFEDIIQALIEAVLEHLEQKQVDQAQQIINFAYETCVIEKVENYMLARTMLLFSIVSKKNKKFDEGLEMADKCIKLLLDHPNLIDIGQAYCIKSIILRKQFKFRISLEAAKRGLFHSELNLKLLETAQNTSGEEYNSLQVSISQNYYSQGLSEIALFNQEYGISLIQKAINIIEIIPYCSGDLMKKYKNKLTQLQQVNSDQRCMKRNNSSKKILIYQNHQLDSSLKRPLEINNNNKFLFINRSQYKQPKIQQANESLNQTSQSVKNIKIKPRSGQGYTQPTFSKQSENGLPLPLKFAISSKHIFNRRNLGNTIMQNFGLQNKICFLNNEDYRLVSQSHTNIKQQEQPGFISGDKQDNELAESKVCSLEITIKNLTDENERLKRKSGYLQIRFSNLSSTQEENQKNLLKMIELLKEKVQACEMIHDKDVDNIRIIEMKNQEELVQMKEQSEKQIADLKEIEQQQKLEIIRLSDKNQHQEEENDNLLAKVQEYEGKLQTYQDDEESYPKNTSDDLIKQQEEDNNMIKKSEAERIIDMESIPTMTNTVNQLLQKQIVLVSEISQLNQHFQQSKEIQNHSERQMIEMKQEIDKLNIQNEAQLNEKQLIIEQIKEDNDTLRQANQSLTIENNQIKEDIQRIEEEYQQFIKEKQTFEELKQSLEEEKQTVEEQRQRIEEEKQSVEEQSQRIEEEKQSVEEQRQRVEEEQQRVEEEKKRVNEEKQTVDEEKQRVNEEKQTVEEEMQRVNEEKETIEEEKQRVNEEKQTVEEEKQRVNEEKQTFEQEKQRVNEEKQRLEEKKQRINNEKQVFDEEDQSEEEEQEGEQRVNGEKQRFEEEKLIFEEEKQKFEEEKHMFVEEKHIFLSEKQTAEEEKHVFLEQQKCLKDKQIIEEENVILRQNEQKLIQNIALIKEQYDRVKQESLLQSLKVNKTNEEEQQSSQLFDQKEDYEFDETSQEIEEDMNEDKKEDLTQSIEILKKNVKMKNKKKINIVSKMKNNSIIKIDYMCQKQCIEVTKNKDKVLTVGINLNLLQLIYNMNNFFIFWSVVHRFAKKLLSKSKDQFTSNFLFHVQDIRFCYNEQQISFEDNYIASEIKHFSSQIDNIAEHYSFFPSNQIHQMLNELSRKDKPQKASKIIPFGFRKVITCKNEEITVNFSYYVNKQVLILKASNPKINQLKIPIKKEDVQKWIVQNQVNSYQMKKERKGRK